MLEGFSLGSYLLLVDYTGRLFRDGKAVISAELAGILERLGSSAESWWARIEKLSKGRLLGRFFAASRERLREVAVAWACIICPTSADARRDEEINEPRASASARARDRISPRRWVVSSARSRRLSGVPIQSASPNHRFEPTPAVALAQRKPTSETPERWRCTSFPQGRG